MTIASNLTAHIVLDLAKAVETARLEGQKARAVARRAARSAGV